MSDTILAPAPAPASAGVIQVASPRPRGAVRDTSTMVGRSIRLNMRAVDAIITSVMLPVMLMLVFVYLFGGAIKVETNYVTYVVPGVLILCAGWGASQTAVSVTSDMKGGIIDRFRSMDVGGIPVISGHVVASVVKNVVSTIVVLGVGLLIGFRPKADFVEWLAVAGILLAFMIAFSWLAAAFGLLAPSLETAGAFGFFMMFVPYLSSAFVPINTMPSWLHGMARHQPMTPVIESLRALLLDKPVGHSGWVALIWCAGIFLVSLLACNLLFKRRTS